MSHDDCVCCVAIKMFIQVLLETMKCSCHFDFFRDFIPYLASCKCHSFLKILFFLGMNKLLLLTDLVLYLLFTNWVQGPYQEIQAQGFSYCPSLRGLFGEPRACISWYGTSTQLVNSLLHDPF